MKQQGTILLILSILILTSCFSPPSSSIINIERKDVLGSWNVTKKSLEGVKKQKDGHKIVTHFELNADSTTTVSFGNSSESRSNGKWVWKAEKELGNKNFGISLKSDVVIYVNGLFTLGLQLNEIDGKISLTAADYIFKRTDLK